MIRPTPRTTLTDTLFPYPTHFRSSVTLLAVLHAPTWGLFSWATLALVGLAAAFGVVCSSGTPAVEGASTPVTDSTPASVPEAGGDTLREVRDRGYVLVGVNNALPGFGFIRPDGTFAGFDVEFGHALAAAIFGDREAVQFVGVSAASRFEALRVHEIDVLIRNTTWTVSRDLQDMTFGVSNFYDGQGVMVRVEDGITTLEDLEIGRAHV